MSYDRFAEAIRAEMESAISKGEILQVSLLQVHEKYLHEIRDLHRSRVAEVERNHQTTLVKLNNIVLERLDALLPQIKFRTTQDPAPGMQPTPSRRDASLSDDEIRSDASASDNEDVRAKLDAAINQRDDLHACMDAGMHELEQCVEIAKANLEEAKKALSSNQGDPELARAEVARKEAALRAFETHLQNGREIVHGASASGQPIVLGKRTASAGYQDGSRKKSTMDFLRERVSEN